MQEMKIVLANKVEIGIDEFGFPPHAVVNCKDKAEAVTIWEKFTEDGLVMMQVMQGGEILAAYQYAVLSGVQVVLLEDGSAVAHFYFTGEKVNPDAEYAEAGRIMLGEQEW